MDQIRLVVPIVSMQLFGTGAGARKAAFLAVARAVGSRLSGGRQGGRLT